MAYWRTKGAPYLGSYAYATLTSTFPAASFSGYHALASDVGVAPGTMLISDGTRWIPLGVQVLARSSAASGMSITGTLTNTALATITVPANLMGLNGSLRVEMQFNGTSSANNKTYTMAFGALVATSVTLTTTANWKQQVIVSNRNSAAVQLAQVQFLSAYGAANSTSQTGTVDTTAAVSLTINGQLANTGETITLERYIVELIP